jgi:fibro-slime domain-containing protein
MTTARTLHRFGLTTTALLYFVACGDPAVGPDDGGGSGAGPSASGGTASDGAGGIVLATGGGLVVPDSGTGGTGSGSMPAMIIQTLPAGFTAAEGALAGSDADELRGGYQLVGPLADVDGTDSLACANVLRVLVRDFTTFSHADFGGLKPPADAAGMVEAALGADRKPVRTELLLEVAVEFGDWYQNVDGINVPYVVDLWLEPDAGKYVFDSSRFFPIDPVTTEDDMQEDMDDVLRNFGFTTELHTSFEYQGGESFTFRGDDDVFVFVNRALVVDLGGVHGPVEGTIAIDDLGLTLGSVYELDLFQAERNPVGSNFRLETTLDFTECGVILPGDVVK